MTGDNLAVNTTSGDDNSGDDTDCSASQNSTSAQNSTSSQNSTSTSDACGKGKKDKSKDQLKDQTASSGKNGGMMKKKMGKTTLNSSCADNSTSLVGAKNNGTSTHDAKQHLKNAQKTIALMMAGNSSVSTDQVNGNVSLAIDAMNNLTMSMG